MYFEIDGKIDRQGTPRDWTLAAPETNATSLLKILCPKP